MTTDMIDTGEIAAFVGIDWADGEHEVCLMRADGGMVESSCLKQSPESLSEWAHGLRDRFGNRKVALALEQRKGPLIYALMCYEWLVLYPVNPKSLARYREAFSVSNAKSDRGDAQLLMEMVRSHRDRLRAWVPENEDTRLLQMLVEERRRVVDEVTRLTNRLTSVLKEYYPQALELAGELKSAQAVDFLTRWPTLEELKRARPATIEKFYHQHGVRNKEKLQQRLASIRAAKQLTRDRAVVTSSVIKMRVTVEQLRVLLKATREYDVQIEELFEKHPDASLFKSFPCAGKVLAPRLASAFGTDRQRWDDAAEVQNFSGIAPVTHASGQTRVVEKRRACPKFLRQTFMEYAAQSVKKSSWARSYYKTMRAKGVKHRAALRALAYKWIRIMYKCWKERTSYSETAYQAALVRAKSPIASRLATL
ncbi:MAG: IS110 family transposase [Blastocatellia bacterium]